VDQENGDDASDGLSWATAQETIRSAIASAEASAGPDVISVAAGRYQEQLVVPAQTTLLGGFPPGGGTRDPDSSPTVIEYAGREGQALVSFWPGSNGGGIDGFVIRGNTQGDYGGGILVDNAAPVIRGNVIEHNRACFGGGLALLRPGLGTQVDGNLIRGNVAEFRGAQCFGWGGGIYMEALPSVDLGSILTGNRIMGNEAFRGGGVSLLSGRGEVVHSVIGGNTPDGMDLHGDVIRLFNVDISGNRFTGLTFRTSRRQYRPIYLAPCGTLKALSGTPSRSST